jgi:hypothetical protein
MQTNLILRNTLKNLSTEAREYCAPHPNEPYRFVVLNNILYIGDFRFHVQLAITATLGDVPSLSTELAQQKEVFWQQSLKSFVSAAGTIGEGKNILSWKSSGFDLVTPEKMRLELNKLIQQTLLVF